ncbi:chemotaxis protein CheB [Mycobacterium sp. E740]|uniref:chemotaxis protein CheB n=1 Tax=Mycobacterium sp. E740 TaxID=1834149 RepID=UPI000AEA9AE2|nr:chemotaxis protein CheB [Mycobacterium sp. E740]
MTSASVFGRVVMVASLGGMDAFKAVLADIPATFPIPMAVVQHRAETHTEYDPLATVLARHSQLPVRIARHGERANNRGVAVVPGAVNATLDSAGRWLLGQATNGTQPGDALLAASAAEVPTLGVILTGYQTDGSEGARAVKRGGGRVLVQDPRTARAAGMPSNAIATGCADFVLPLHRLAAAMVALTVAPGAADLLAVPLPPWARLTS